MRHAFVSDIHANIQAWNAVLEDIRRQEIKHIINLGDVVGYGPSPKEVLESVRDHSEISVIGNHDAVCAGRMDDSIFNDIARAAIKWTRQQLDAEQCQFFVDMAEKARPDGAGFVAAHAEVIAPLDFGYILTEEDAKKNFAACDDKLIFIGHTHRPGIFVLDQSGKISIEYPASVVCDPEKRYIINPGSVGDPRSEDIVASYCIYDSKTRELTFHRVKFDTDAYRRTLDASGLTEPPFFIRYLDSLEANKNSVTIIPPPKIENYAISQKGLTPQVPAATEKKISKPIILITSTVFTLIAGCAWLTISHLNKDNEAAQIQTETLEEKPTAAKAEITLDTEPPEEVKPAIPKSLPNIPPTINFPVARYVRIEGRRIYPLHFAEVEVYSNESNIALAKKATQSSTRYKASFASRAIDGSKKGKAVAQLAFTRMEKPDHPWWEVDLGKDYPIEAILIFNREGSDRIKKRINGSHIILRNEAGEEVYRMPQKIIPESGLIKPLLRHDPTLLEE